MAHFHRLRSTLVGPVLLWACCVGRAQAQAHDGASVTVAADPADAHYVVARPRAGVTSQLRRTLAIAGYREVGILPGRRLLLQKIASTARQDEVKLHDELTLAPYGRGERISRELLQPPATGADIPVLIHAMPGTTGEAALQWLAASGLPRLGAGRAGDSFRISTRLPAARAAALADELASLQDVFFVERIHHLGLFNDRSAGTIQSGMQGVSEAATPIWSRGLRGQGQIVGLIDTGVDADSCWFSGPSEPLPRTNTWSETGGYGTEVDESHSKVIAYDFLYSCDQFASQLGCDEPSQSRAWDSNGHGTHCSGSMVGHRTSGGNNGMAPEAKLVVQDAGYQTNDCADLPGIGCPVVDLYPLFEQAYMQGVRIHNNSYGDNENAATPEPSNYSARSQDVDRFIWDHKDMLLVFAAGNSGNGNADFSVCSPSTNKNGLSVGSARTSPAANSDEDISSFSSRGWTADGRVKPDLIAPGCNASAGTDRNSTTHNCTENSGCGTSYASPVLVGAAALVRQYLTDGYYPSGTKNTADALQPTAALLKAMLINGAVAMQGHDNAGQAISPIPSNEQGWGRIQLDRSLVFEAASRKLFLDDHAQGFEAGSNAAISYTFDGVGATEPLKATLVWTDYPGAPDSAPRAPELDDMASLNAPQLVNDLDLEVSDGTTTYLGNVFEDGASVPAGAPDQRNNVEQVLIATPSTATWTVRVRASSVAMESQDYALVVTGQWASATADAQAGAQQPAAAGAGARMGSAGAGPVIGAAGHAAASAGATAQTAPEAGATATSAAQAGDAPETANPAHAMTGESGAGAMGSGTLAESAPSSGTQLATSTSSDAPTMGDNSGCSLTRQTGRTNTEDSQAWLLWLASATAAWTCRARTRKRRHASAAARGRSAMGS